MIMINLNIDKRTTKINIKIAIIINIEILLEMEIKK